MIPSSVSCSVCKMELKFDPMKKGPQAVFCDRCGSKCCKDCVAAPGAEMLATHQWCSTCRAEFAVTGGNVPDPEKKG